LFLSSRLANWLANFTEDSIVNMSFSLFFRKDSESVEKLTHGEMRNTPLSGEGRIREGMLSWAWRRLEIRPSTRFPPAEPPPITTYGFFVRYVYLLDYQNQRTSDGL